MYYTYILHSLTNDIFYIGYSHDLKQRIEQHNLNKVATTSGKGPWELQCYISFKSKEKALAFEKYLKSSSGFAFRNKRLI